MVKTADITCIPYTTDLTEAGIRYACRSLPYLHVRAGRSLFDRMRSIVAGIAVELAFRRYLTEQNVPFDVKGAAPFSEPGRYDVTLGGRRCDIKTFLISHREQIKALRADPAQLLSAQALVPLDQQAADDASAGRLYLFAFVAGLTATTPEEIEKARLAGQPIHFVHAMPNAWVRPRTWIPMGPLALKSDCETPLSLEVGGQDSSREFITVRLELPPHSRFEVNADFHSVAYLQMESRPPARLGIHSPTRRETYVIQPADWGNIHVYGTQIYLAGWLARAEFRERAALLPEGRRVFQYDRTRTKNLALPISELRPLDELLARVRDWASPRDRARLQG